MFLSLSMVFLLASWWVSDLGGLCVELWLTWVCLQFHRRNCLGLCLLRSLESSFGCVGVFGTGTSGIYARRIGSMGVGIYFILSSYFSREMG